MLRASCGQMLIAGRVSAVPSADLHVSVNVSWVGDLGATHNGNFQCVVEIPDPIPLVGPSFHDRIITAVRDQIRAESGDLTVQSNQIASPEYRYNTLLS